MPSITCISVTDITAVIAVMTCSKYTEEINSRGKEAFVNITCLAVLERGCSRTPPDIGVGVPYLKNNNDVVPFLVDIRWNNRLIEKWDDIIILHDSSTGKKFM